MKPRHFALLLLFIILVVGGLSALSAPSPWESIAPGIDYQEYHLEDPNNVYVARMERSNQGVFIDSSIAMGRFGGGLEKVSEIAQRYDQAINFWGQSWGGRNQVVVAINGSFYGGDGIPLGGQIQSGWYAKRFDDYGGNSGFAWKLDRSVFIGGCVYHLPNKQLIKFLTISPIEDLAFDGINVERGNNQLILYTPHYGSNTRTSDNGLEVLVEMTKPTVIYPTPASAEGYIREIRDGQGSTNIPFDHIVLSARGIARTELLAKLAKVQIGDKIGISQEIAHREDCDPNNPSLPSWRTTYASIQGSFVFLKDGIIQTFVDPGALESHPRTAIAFNENYIYFIVVDGRAPGISVGMTITELATFAQQSLGATWGVAEDGGGSSVMVINGVVKNKPSDPCYMVFVPYVSQRNPNMNRKGSNSGAENPTLPSIGWCERSVANGLMMVVQQPLQKSTSFTPGDQVATVRRTDLRLGPGTNYPVLASIPTGTDGEILHHFNDLDGVFAKGSYWWKVKFGGLVGWAPAGTLMNLEEIFDRGLPVE